jgi:steroid 5-alpha reductase family enzyme
MPPLPTLFASAVLLMILFVMSWRFSIRHNNYSSVDVVWSFAFAPVAILYALCLDGWGPRRIAIAVLISLWSLRLGSYLWRRVAAHHPEEDPRYAVLRRRWSADLKAAFLKFFLAQAALVWLLMLPVYLICQQAAPGFAALEWLGFTLWFVALYGEGVADLQLRRFKKNSARSQVCRVGLWRYSRHPNYFFQSLLWWGLFLMALPAPWGWAAILAPLAMLWFLLRVTGIPLTEKLAVESKGDAYREYQRSTSPLVPWFTKPSKENT